MQWRSLARTIHSLARTTNTARAPKSKAPKYKARKMKIAIEGCCHGELDAIYSHIKNLEQRERYKVDLLLICGDFQAMRNYQDLEVMACPPKYRALHDFHKYYTGEKKAPILTLVIGGNHEASNYLFELYHGGWLAPNIYFLGHSGCVQVNGVRIAGASGIFKSHDFKLGSYETLPYDHSSMRSIYHTREFCVRKLSLLSSPNIFLSHDWPLSIEQYGDVQRLLKVKAHFRREVEQNALGSPPLMGLLRTLKPEWWFSAHMHTRFEARFFHGEPAGPPSPELSTPLPVANPDEITIDDEDFTENSTAVSSNQVALGADEKPVVFPIRNPDEIALDDEEVAVERPPPILPPPLETKFLALDKCLPKRQFLEVIDVRTPEDTPLGSRKDKTPVFSFDPEWLAITRAFQPWFSTIRYQQPFPEEEDARSMVKRELNWVKENIKTNSQGIIPIEDHQVFACTAPGPNQKAPKNEQPPWYVNPQTQAFCRMLDMEDKVNSPPSAGRGIVSPRPNP